MKCLSLYPWSDEALREVHLYLEQYLKRNFERFDSPRTWMDSGELPQNPATLYGRAFMPVKYRRDAHGKWTRENSRADV